VFGRLPTGQHGPVRQSGQDQPGGPVGLSHQAAELYVRRWSGRRGIPHVAGRLGVPAGDHHDHRTAVTKDR